MLEVGGITTRVDAVQGIVREEGTNISLGGILKAIYSSKYRVVKVYPAISISSPTLMA